MAKACSLLITASAGTNLFPQLETQTPIGPVKSVTVADGTFCCGKRLYEEEMNRGGRCRPANVSVLEHETEH